MKGGIKMPKSRKRKKGRKAGKYSVSSRSLPFKTQVGSVQQRIQQERERMLSILNFDEHLRGQVEEMFNINLEGLPAGKEPMFFSTAVFKIDNAELAMRKIERLRDVDLTEKNKDGAHYIWTRAYPKGHWNPMSNMPGARQVIGDIQVSFDNTLKLETKTKSWLTALIYLVMSVLGKEIRLISLEFQNPLDMLKK